MERLREHLEIDRWLVWGGSWGSVLGLVYAERYPERVSEIVLTAIATGRQVEVDLLTRGLGQVFPEAWTRFRDAVPAERQRRRSCRWPTRVSSPMRTRPSERRRRATGAIGRTR